LGGRNVLCFEKGGALSQGTSEIPLVGQGGSLRFKPGVLAIQAETNQPKHCHKTEAKQSKTTQPNNCRGKPIKLANDIMQRC
jgi:hypothetical protein